MKTFLMIIGILVTVPLFGIDIKLIEKVPIEQNKDNFIQKTRSFAVTEDDMIMIVDYKASNVKLYSKNGKLIKVWGRKGMGPKEFGAAFICHFEGKKFALLDVGKHNICIYKRTGKTDFKLEKEIFASGLGFDMKLNGDKLLISGFKKSKKGESYDLYLQNLAADTTRLLIPSYIKYGLNSAAEYKKKYFGSSDIIPIGIGGYCAWYKNNIYLVWEGDLRITKLDFNTGKISFSREESPDYIKPHPTRELVQNYNLRNSNKLRELKKKMSYVVDVFAGKDFVGVTYGNEDKNSLWHFVIQFFDHDGKFLGEKKLTGMKPASTNYIFLFKPDVNMLTYLHHSIDKELEDRFTLLKYKISK